MPGVADLDFRDIEGVDDRTAILLSAGQVRNRASTNHRRRRNLVAARSPIPNPKDSGTPWHFWDPSHGIIVGDPVDGRFSILTTSDGGVTWQKSKGPPA